MGTRVDSEGRREGPGAFNTVLARMGWCIADSIPCSPCLPFVAAAFSVGLVALVALLVAVGCWCSSVSSWGTA